jgi:phosphoribosylformimino-5-aminoimidazole carboxamide ribotide isomerase
MKIIPAIDIYNGKCVRLLKGDYNLKKEYSSNPLLVAKEFENNGATHLHVVDLEGAKSNTIVNSSILQDICSNTDLKVDFGGGIKTKDDISLAFDLGVNQITLGSLAVTNKDLLIDSLNVYGKEKIILGADFLDNVIKINGWKTTTEYNLFDFINEYNSYGIKYAIITDISKDGAMQGSSVEIYSKIIKKFPALNLIASGGVTCEDDLNKLKKIGCYGAIVGKALYEKRIDLKEMIIEYGS